MFFLSFFALAAGADDETTIVAMDQDEIEETTNRCAEPCADENQKPESGDVKEYTAELIDGSQGYPGRGYCLCNPQSGDFYQDIADDFVRACKDTTDADASFHPKHSHLCTAGWETVKSDADPDKFAKCHNSATTHCLGSCFNVEDEIETEDPCGLSRGNVIGNTHDCRCKKNPTVSL